MLGMIAFQSGKVLCQIDLNPRYQFRQKRFLFPLFPLFCQITLLTGYQLQLLISSPITPPLAIAQPSTNPSPPMITYTSPGLYEFPLSPLHLSATQVP